LMKGTGLASPRDAHFTLEAPCVLPHGGGHDAPVKSDIV